MSKQHKEVLNKHKLHILSKMAAYSILNKTNEIPLSMLRSNINDYNNAQKLRYHALIFKVKRGTWGITKHGLDFLRGNKELPEWVLIEDNHIVERSLKLIKAEDIYDDGSVNTKFAYFKDGVYIGDKPE